MNKCHLLFAIAISLICNIGSTYSQVVTEKSFDWLRLPVDASDFHSYKGHHPLQSYKLYDTSIYNVYTAPIVDIFERKGAVKSISLKIYVYTKKFGELVISPNPVYNNFVTYDSSGNIIDYTNLQGLVERDGMGIASEVGRKVKKETNSEGLVTRAASYQCDDNIKYEYDSKNRVILANACILKGSIHENNLIFKYSYFPNSNKVSEIVAYDGKSGESIGKAEYEYSGDKIVRFMCTKLNGETFKKTFTYDSKGSIKHFQFTEIGVIGDVRTFDYEFTDCIYTANGYLSKCNYTKTDPNHQESEALSKSFKYDANGNWIELIDGLVVVKREIKY